jgi:hypothetical protein
MNGRGAAAIGTWLLRGVVAVCLLAPPRLLAGGEACPLPPASIEDVRARAEARCERRGMTCETGVLDYVRCVNAAVAAAVSRGRMPRECRRAAEVSPALCAQPRSPGQAGAE